MNNFSITVSTAALIMSMISVDTAHAQQSSDDINDDKVYSDVIVVTARKKDENLQQVPLAVSVLTADEIERKGVRDISAVGDFTPGIQLERANRYGTQGGSSRPVIRGMGNILGEPNAQVFIDGVPYSESILSFPFDLVERVEIIKGPQAALYGRATFAGAINLITKRGTNDSRNSVSARIASHDDYEINLLSRGPIIEDKLFYTAHARYYDFGGMYRNSLDNKRVGGEQSYNLNGSLEFRPSSDMSILLSGGYIRDSDDHPAIVTQDRFANNCHLDAPRQYYCGPVNRFEETTLDLASLKGKVGLLRESYRASLIMNYETNGFKITSNSGYFNTKTEFVHDSTYQGATALGRTTVPGAPGYVRPANNGVRTGAVLRNEVGEREELFTELRIQSPKISDAFDVMIGGAYYKRRRPLEERHFEATAPTIDSGTDRIDNIAVFGAINWDITNRLAASAELRYAEDTIGNYKSATNVLAERKFASTSPRFTLDYAINDSSMVYGTIAKGNKPGVFNSDPRFPVDVQFAGEESSWNYEIGSKNMFFNNRLTLNLAAYYVDWSNQQLSASYMFPDNSTRSYIVNAGRTKIKGVELELQGRLSNELTAGISYSLNDATFTEFDDAEAMQLFGNPSVAGNLVPNISKNQASAFVNYNRPISSDIDFFARADAAYNEEKFAQIYNLASTGDQYLVNLRTGIQGPSWKFTFFIDNVTDNRTPSTVIRWVDQLNLNVPQYVNANPAQNNVPGSTTLERGFQVALARKRQFGVSLNFDF